MHLIDVGVGMLGASAIVGGSIPLAVGAAMSASLRGETRVAVAFFGDGAVEQGVFHECLNLAALRRLPVIFACENNLYATLSHVRARQAAPIHARAASYGMPGVAVDGTDVEAVRAVATEAAERARRGEGPTLIEATAYRWMSHVGTEFDTGRMQRTQDELDAWRARCPLVIARAQGRGHAHGRRLLPDGEVRGAADREGGVLAPREGRVLRGVLRDDPLLHAAHEQHAGVAVEAGVEGFGAQMKFTWAEGCSTDSR